MKSFKFAFILSLIFSSLAFADEMIEETFVDLDPMQMVAQSSRVEKARKKLSKAKQKEKDKESKRKFKERANSSIPDNWRLKFDYPIELIQPNPSIFFQSNIGVGFLYFSGSRGNFMGSPTNAIPGGSADDAPLRGSFTYNRTPLYENILGYRILPWLSSGLSYQHQGGIYFQTAATSALSTAPNTVKAMLEANVILDGFMAKTTFEVPHPAIIRRLAITPALGLGIGIGWQTWNRIQVSGHQLFNNGITVASTSPLRQKISANLIWMADAGVRLQSTNIDSNISLTMGCKYNQWGQARNMGKLSQQGSYKLGLLNPFRIKTVYQFAPYLGLQWDFPNTYVSKRPYLINDKDPSSFVPIFIKTSEFQPRQSLWTQVNAGVGFLYFSKVRANLAGVPRASFLVVNPSAGTTVSNDAPLRGKLGYNRTPLFEYLIGYRILPWIKAALSYQHQGEVAISTPFLDNTVTPNPNNLPLSSTQLRSTVNFDGLMAKCYFELPFGMALKNVACSPLIGAGCGIGWQSWTDVQVNYITERPRFSGIGLLPMNGKVSPNFIWGVDAALKFRSVFPKPDFSVLLGCRYNQWGQTLNVGMLSQQSSHKFAIVGPLRIQTVYQFAPYAGVQWNFPTTYAHNKPYTIDQKPISRWKPFFVKPNLMDKGCGFSSQFNVGAGFLYFSGIVGNFAPQPNQLFFVTAGSNIPFKGRLKYNKTPLYEYLLSYRFASWYKLSLSYQHQGDVVVSTKWIRDTNQRHIQFQSNVTLDGIMLKNYFEYPIAMICRGIATTPYIAVGGGAGWQSWSKNHIVSSLTTFLSSAYKGIQFNTRQKISANFVWMADIGFRFRSALPNPGLNVVLGCKYNQWGQARSIGKASKQGRNKMLSFLEPFRIKTVYQFAPYAGVQWNF